MPTTLQEVIATAPFHLPADVVKQMENNNESASLAEKGDGEAGKGNWSLAVADYQQALTLWPNDQAALYGLGDYSLTKGYTQAALGYYYQAVYTHPEPPQLPQFQEPNAYRLMEYALLLSQTGQQEEALAVYRHAAQTLNVHLRMPLPDFGDNPGQVPFTPQRLQAMALVGWAYDHDDFDRAGAWARLQQAVTLSPDSPVPYFYRARYEARYGTDYKAAGADFDKAAQLSDADTADAVQQERHLFQYRIDAATQAAHPPKTTP